MSTQTKDTKDPNLKKKRRTVKTESRSSSPDSSTKKSSTKSKSHDDLAKQVCFFFKSIINWYLVRIRTTDPWSIRLQKKTNFSPIL